MANYRIIPKTFADTFAPSAHRDLSGNRIQLNTADIALEMSSLTSLSLL